MQQTQYTDFLASLGSMILTFLAGAEIDPDSLRRHLKASLTIGFLSFLMPFLGAFAFCYLVLDWTLHAAEIGGVALSTTSVAVVYAVMVETGLNREPLGKLILAACFVTDLGAVVLWFLPSLLRLIVARLGHRVSEPEIKFLLLVLLGLGGLAVSAGSEAVLPAYVAGLVVAGVFARDRVILDRIRTIAFALLTPFFFLRAGLLINASALVSGAGIIALLLVVKLAAKFVGVWPTARFFGLGGRDRMYTTLLMATGLTFGSIAALYGLTHGLVTQAQYSELVTVVILSAFVPTIIAQQMFAPQIVRDEEEEEVAGAEDLGVITHQAHRHQASGNPEGREEGPGEVGT